MGYACPVCATPQRDGEHLAHHLAFTAMLHGDEHETWLDDHVTEWVDREPADLAAAVTPHAADAEYHEVFEDTVDRGRPDVDVETHARGGHAHGHAEGGHAGHGHAGAAGGRGGVDETGATDPETAAALREARDLTREMLSDDGAGDTDEADDGDGGTGDGTDGTSDDGDSSA
ncbi:DUF5810 domain-containing protein [Halorubrum aidingense]|nr:DUF5810 domain-containing protein [Halorubrum aidingense]